jgi:acyl-CoA dehydrogenase
VNSDLVTLIDDLAGSHKHDLDASVLPPIWSTLIDLGFTQIGVDEKRGGSGGDLSDLLTVVRRLAHHGVDVPLVETAVAAWALTGPLDDTKPVLAVFAPRRGHNEILAPWAAACSRLLLAGPEGTVMARVRSYTGQPAAVVLDRDSSTIRTAPGAKALETRLLVTSAARLAGAAAGAYRLTRDFVRTREQFGKPLLEIPAVAANLARIRTEVDLAVAALDRAERLVGADPEDWGAAAIAVLTALHTADQTVTLAHQLHGAMGIALEYPLGWRTRILRVYRNTLPADCAARLGGVALAGGEPAVWGALTGHVLERTAN